MCGRAMHAPTVVILDFSHTYAKKRKFTLYELICATYNRIKFNKVSFAKLTLFVLYNIFFEMSIYCSVTIIPPPKKMSIPV